MAIALRNWLLSIGLALAASTGSTEAAFYYYVDWTAADPSAGTASGVITLPDSSTVGVTFAATYAGGVPGSFLFAQIAGDETNYWEPSEPYISSQVQNAPPDSDLLALEGGESQIYTVTLSEPIKDPIMALVSLGNAGNEIAYNFDSPFTIVSQGTGYWGGDGTSLQQLPGNVLAGAEGHGTIQFLGEFSTFSWLVPAPETWHGFTFGIRTTEALEPSPVPEPSSLTLLGIGGLIGAIRLCRRGVKPQGVRSPLPC